jgi:hypothetical protein
VTELVGWEHSMKNELIVATYKNLPRKRPAERLQQVLAEVGLEEMAQRFQTGDTLERANESANESATEH